MGYVYKITFPDGYFYIGATINLDQYINKIVIQRLHKESKAKAAK